MKFVLLLTSLLFAAGIAAIVYGAYFACQAGELCNIAISQEYNTAGVFFFIIGALVIVFKAVPEFLKNH